jgi:hypothetical protein
MKNSFPEILNNSKLVIPIIQRDYAQGRVDHRTERIRKNFLDAIFGVLEKRISNQADTQPLELDFIYGFSRDDKNDHSIFSPIDGQQRLTTLWLLWWFVGAKEKATDKEFLSNFRYETRHSSTVFCEQLLSFQPEFNFGNIEKEIKNQFWYFENWDYDPGIQSMLVMLKDIEQRYIDLGSQTLWSVINHPDSPLYFYKLDMDKVGLPDDLYIKMNSRGKPLTEFEYFKANFSDIISDETLRTRFQHSIDQEWAEVIWKIVASATQAKRAVGDLAFLVDSCFMRLINFITDVIAYKQGIPFHDVTDSQKEVKTIYQQEANLSFLFDILDLIVVQQNREPNFWNDLFYLDKPSFTPEKTRLFFQNGNINLLEKCLFYYNKNSKEFSYPEQILLYACIIHRLEHTKGFRQVARIVRNLTVNSSNELRTESIGQSFSEIENFVRTQHFDYLVHFKTDQIGEEKEKTAYISLEPAAAQHIYRLEDSDLLRGCISVFDLDEQFISRQKSFLSLFDEDSVTSDFINRANVLLCFGDYSQKDGGHCNLLAGSKGNWRTFFTTPAFNKRDLIDKTKPALMNCLDYFSTGSRVSIEQKIKDTLRSYESNAKDWKYYFLKYPGFRLDANKGYYHWISGSQYTMFKMKEKQFNGYYWDPFLIEIKTNTDGKHLELNNGGKMSFSIGNDLLYIESIFDGFFISNGNSNGEVNTTLDALIANGRVSPEGYLPVEQDERDFDLQDRIEMATLFVKNVAHMSASYGAVKDVLTS